MSVGSWHVIFGEIFISSAHFFNGFFGLFCFDTELYELFACFGCIIAEIFPHPGSCLFILFMLSFAVQKLLSLLRSHLFLFLFPLA